MAVHRKKAKLVVNTEATCVHNVICKFMCNGSRQMWEQMMIRGRIKRNRAKRLIMAFVEKWLLPLYRGVCGCGVRSRSGGIVTKTPSVKQISGCQGLLLTTSAGSSPKDFYVNILMSGTHLPEKGCQFVLAGNTGGLLHAVWPVWHCKVLCLLDHPKLSQGLVPHPYVSWLHQATSKKLLCKCVRTLQSLWTKNLLQADLTFRASLRACVRSISLLCWMSMLLGENQRNRVIIAKWKLSLCKYNTIAKSKVVLKALPFFFIDNFTFLTVGEIFRLGLAWNSPSWLIRSKCDD